MRKQKIQYENKFNLFFNVFTTKLYNCLPQFLKNEFDGKIVKSNVDLLVKSQYAKKGLALLARYIFFHCFYGCKVNQSNYRDSMAYQAFFLKRFLGNYILTKID